MNVKVSAAKFIKSGKPAVIVNSEYHPKFVEGARKLNGKFAEPDKWTFDGRDTEAVEELCRQIYGSTGADGVELVDIRIRVPAYVRDDLYAYGRKVAANRTTYVKLGTGVVIIDGEFIVHLDREKYTTVEIRDVPITLVKDREIIVRRPAADITPKTRPFENATKEELEALLDAIRVELELRQPSTSQAATEIRQADGEVYLTEDNAGFLTIGREDFWIGIPTPEDGKFEAGCYRWQQANEIRGDLAVALLDLDPDRIFAEAPAAIVAKFDGEVVTIVRNLGLSAQRYVGNENVRHLDRNEQWA